MTAPDQQYGWIVRVTAPRRVWMSSQGTRAGARELRDQLLTMVADLGSGDGLLLFPLRSDGSEASIRARDVVSVELLGPRSETRPAPTPADGGHQYEVSVSVPPAVSGTDWLREMAVHTRGVLGA